MHTSRFGEIAKFFVRIQENTVGTGKHRLNEAPRIGHKDSAKIVVLKSLANVSHTWGQLTNWKLKSEF